MSIAPSASVSHLPPFFLFFFFFNPISVWLRLHTALGLQSNTKADLKKYIPGAHVDSFVKQSVCRCLSSKMQVQEVEGSFTCASLRGLTQ